MPTEIEDPETPNDVPPVARAYGLAVSEWVTYSFIVVSVIALIFGSMVGGERDAQAERAMVTLAALAEKAENKFAVDRTLVCDDKLLEPELLANDYLSLSIKQAPFNEDNKSLGYGPALYVSVVEDEVSGDTWDTAKRLMELVEKAGEEEAEANEDVSRQPNVEVNPAASEDEASEEDNKPKNRLREVREKGFDDDEDYLQYYILASEVAICSPST